MIHGHVGVGITPLRDAAVPESAPARWHMGVISGITNMGLIGQTLDRSPPTSSPPALGLAEAP